MIAASPLTGSARNTSPFGASAMKRANFRPPAKTFTAKPAGARGANVAGGGTLRVGLRNHGVSNGFGSACRASATARRIPRVDTRPIYCDRMLRDLRRLAIARTLFRPTTLNDAIQRLGFVQADPIRAPARAQDLTLRHRVAGYRAGDLERRYPDLDVEEDVFINYGYVSRRVAALMHPRTTASRAPSARTARERALLAFVRERGEAHPRDVDRQFSHGNVTNYWGGSSRATTHLLEHMQYSGLVRIVRRDRGVRVYAVREHAARPLDAAGRRARIDALVDVVVSKYAPLPALSLAMVVARLRYAAPQWRGELRAALASAQRRLRRERVDGVEWFWPEGGRALRDAEPDGRVRLLTPFDPIVWDRRRFELLWGWPYRFEAYTPARLRKFGYYALPIVWRDDVVGWANLTAANGALDATFGYARGRPRDRRFARELSEEVDRIRAFLRERTR